MDSKQSKVRVLMLPWLAHGHISPFLELAKRLITRNFHIYICSTAINLSSIEKKISPKYSESIDLIELQLPYLPDLPPQYQTTNGLPPRLMITLKNAYEMTAPRFAEIVTNLNPDFVIYDFNQPWAAEISSDLNIPAVQFLTGGAGLLVFGLHMMKNSQEKFPFPEIYLRDYEREKLQDVEINDEKDANRFIQAMEKSHKVLLVKSFREIEGKYFDYISSLSGKRVIPLGPLVQDDSTDEENEQNGIEILQWLEKQGKSSVVFVSFGSEYFLTGEEITEIAHGLEKSKVGFIWVLRFPHGDNRTIEESSPKGFLERTNERGKVVKNWAPQAKILKSLSIGGFVSHCGWSSVMESMKFGVPIIAMPMHIDQPLNARIVEEVGIGLEAIRDENGKLQSEEIGKIIRKVVVDESGENVRKKAKEMRERLRIKGDEEIDSLVKEILVLCNNTYLL